MSKQVDNKTFDGGNKKNPRLSNLAFKMVLPVLCRIGRRLDENNPHPPPSPIQIVSLSTIDLLVLNSLEQLLVILQTLFTFYYKTSYLNEEVSRAEPSPSVSVPWSHPITSCPLILYDKKATVCS
jgi:hypothetical protein